MLMTSVHLQAVQLSRIVSDSLESLPVETIQWFRTAFPFSIVSNRLLRQSSHLKTAEKRRSVVSKCFRLVRAQGSGRPVK